MYRTLKLVAGIVFAAVVMALPSRDPVPSDDVVDCSMRKLAYDFSKKIIPGQWEESWPGLVFDGLELRTKCNMTLPHFMKKPVQQTEGDEEDVQGAEYRPVLHISVHGDDSYDGLTVDTAMKTLRAGLERRLQYPSETVVELRVHPGRHELREPLKLGHQHSNTVIKGASSSERTVLTGSVEVDPFVTWAQSAHNPDIWYCVLPKDIFSSTPTGLFVNGVRQIRARFPNANPETQGLWTPPNTGYVPSAVSWLDPKPPFSSPVEVTIQSPQRNGTHFPQFMLGVGGMKDGGSPRTVSQFEPPQSFWGVSNPPGGGGATYVVPSGMVYNTSGSYVPHRWANASGGIVHAFHGLHWGNWMFEIESVNQDNGTIFFGRGGYQEARGSKHGAEWYVENIFEELDSPGEWFFNETTRMLWLWSNATDAKTKPPTGVSVTQLTNLMHLEGTSSIPIFNVNIDNIDFRETDSTFMHAYMVPSGGDCSVHLDGAVYVRDSDAANISRCSFSGIGGNAVVVLGRNVRPVVQESMFRWIGDNAIVLVGFPSMIDGTQLQTPQHAQILSNLASETGIFGKQSSPFFQSVTYATNISGNIFFNGARAGINFNDGYGGNHTVEGNLVFNQVRETADHGPFNSWDRQPYLFPHPFDGEPFSLVPLESYLTGNLFMNAYHSVWPIDHDDGSCFYTDTGNVLIYGGYKNFLGHNKTVMDNLYLYPDLNTETGFSNAQCANDYSGGAGDNGYGEVWSNNTCVLFSTDIVYNFRACSLSDLSDTVPTTNYNHFYTSTGGASVQCGSQKYQLANYTALTSMDSYSTISASPSVMTVVDWAKQLLGI